MQQRRSREPSGTNDPFGLNLRLWVKRLSLTWRRACDLRPSFVPIGSEGWTFVDGKEKK
jgi:hypothetical protein